MGGSWASAAVAQGEQTVPSKQAGCQMDCWAPPEAAVVVDKSSLCEGPSPALQLNQPPPWSALSSLAGEDAWW